MKRVTIFAKGNVDVHDSLHSCRIGGSILWNGINDVLRGAFPDVRVRLRHETLTRFDAMIAANGTVPGVLDGHEMPLGNYPLAGQFSEQVFTTPSDAIVLSILPDVASTLLRHEEEGFLFYPADVALWPDAERRWLVENFEQVGLVSVEESMASLAAAVDRLREMQDIPILVYNMSPVIPGDRVHCYLGLDETYGTRIRRFNLALVELSQALGISIVDVEGVVARKGADLMKIDAMHLTPEGYKCVAEEVVRVLDDLGVFSGGETEP
ncbi:MAG: SGNH/GDSL hydrolase family protein [Sphingomonadales bacterium]|nr:SGNH/GDSL hydrolase family protein [Sphingomonadales bacterium]